MTCIHIYMNAAATVLKPLDVVYHSAMHFIMGNRFSTHHFILYQKVTWPSLKINALLSSRLHKLPPYLVSLLTYVRATGPGLRDGQLWTSLPSLLSCLAPYGWNDLQYTFKMEECVPLGHFRLLGDLFTEDCVCFLWLCLAFRVR